MHHHPSSHTAVRIVYELNLTSVRRGDYTVSNRNPKRFDLFPVPGNFTRKLPTDARSSKRKENRPVVRALTNEIVTANVTASQHQSTSRRNESSQHEIAQPLQSCRATLPIDFSTAFTKRPSRVAKNATYEIRCVVSFLGKSNPPPPRRKDWTSNTFSAAVRKINDGCCCCWYVPRVGPADAIGCRRYYAAAAGLSPHSPLPTMGENNHCPTRNHTRKFAKFDRFSHAHYFTLTFLVANFYIRE